MIPTLLSGSDSWPQELRVVADHIVQYRACGPFNQPVGGSSLGQLGALPLRSESRRIGALNLYARDASAFGAAEAQRAADFAENAAGALTLAIRLASRAALIEQLRSSLVSRTVIDQALGIVMAREHCTQARAFAILRSASQHSNVKLRDIASAIITSVSGEPPQPPPAFEHDNLSMVLSFRVGESRGESLGESLGESRDPASAAVTLG
jgi:hypothetical protein